MTDLEKARFILKHLNENNFNLSGAQEAFRFVQSYGWLLELAKKLEEKQKEQKNGN